MKIAIITGASSGIGMEFARQMDAGFKNIDEFWLVARREDALQELSAELNHVCRVFPMDITEEEKESGHGGMDGIMLRQFIDRCRSGEPFALDVYDAAAWMAITVLSEQSISLGGAQVSIPDFTNGQWMHRDRLDVI
jgi:NAD(P)-dependent dehydrogenase (short-subunit alcohol dehydrogenase family)